MRKISLTLASVLALVLALCACGAEAQTAKEEASAVVEATSTPEPSPEPSPTPEPEPVIDYEITYTSCKVATDSQGRNTYAYVIIVAENTGDCAISLDYETLSYYDLVDENGNIVETKNLYGGNPTVMEPGEKAYFSFQEVITTGEKNLSVVPYLCFRESIDEIKFLPVSDVTFGRDPKEYCPNGVIASGTVKNTTGKMVTSCTIYAVLFSGDEPVCVLTSYVYDPIHADAEAAFSTMDGRDMQMFVNLNNVTSCEAFAYILK